MRKNGVGEIGGQMTIFELCVPKLPIVSLSIVTNLTLLYYFLILFPTDHVKGTMILGMNRRLPEGDSHLSEH